MKKMLAVLVLMVVMSLCSIAQAFDGRQPNEILGQLSADKELLFHQAMRGVWEATTNIRDQIKGLEAEIKGVLNASEFNEALFLEKTRSLQELQKMVREAMDEAIAKLAGQFTEEERKILGEFISRKPGPQGPPPGL